MVIMFRVGFWGLICAIPVELILVILCLGRKIEKNEKKAWISTIILGATMFYISLIFLKSEYWAIGVYLREAPFAELIMMFGIFYFITPLVFYYGLILMVILIAGIIYFEKKQKKFGKRYFPAFYWILALIIFAVSQVIIIIDHEDLSWIWLMIISLIMVIIRLVDYKKHKEIKK